VDRRELTGALGRRYARAITNVVVRRPRLWRLFRGSLRLQFERIAPRWDAMRVPDHLAPLERALEEVEPPPRRVLDLGTGTGSAALAAARRFPQAEVVGVDLAEKMIAEARRKVPPELRERVRFESGDAARLPYGDGAFDLVTLANMIPFFDELDRVLAPDGHAVFGFSGGPATPIYVPPERLRAELGRRGFAHFAEFAVGRGTAFLARKGGGG
jgi:SAM-dependent methyltransferase